MTAIAGDGHGDLWLATDHCGLYHLSADGSRSEHFKPGVAGMPATVMSILLDSGGGLWLGSSWSGVVRMDPATGECTDISAWAKGGDKIPNAYALAGRPPRAYLDRHERERAVPLRARHPCPEAFLLQD